MDSLLKLVFRSGILTMAALTGHPHRQSEGPGRSRHGRRLSVSQALHFSLNVAVAVILARVLSPEDFGVFAIAFAVIGFLEFANMRDRSYP